MPIKDQTAKRDYHRDYMRRRRADAAVEQKNFVISKEEQSTPADQGKCFWSVNYICILHLSPKGNPIKCNGIREACEGKLEDLVTIPFRRN